jgi:hypothetical protein
MRRSHLGKVAKSGTVGASQVPGVGAVRAMPSGRSQSGGRTQLMPFAGRGNSGSWPASGAGPVDDGAAVKLAAQGMCRWAGCSAKAVGN